MTLALLVVLGQAAATLLLAWLYFRRYAVTRPPIGVVNLADVAVMIGAIVLIPYLYLSLPLWLMVGLLALGLFSIAYNAWEPVLRRRWAVWSVAALLVGADLVAAFSGGTASAPFFAVNNLVLLVAIVGVANLWAQSGMKARDLVLLTAALTVYDFIATSRLTMMGDMITRTSHIPFLPMVAWPVSASGAWLGIGLGDLSFAAVFPLVMRKAFGRTAGLIAMLVALGAIAGLLAVAQLGLLREVFPVMVVLGPLTVLQYAYWRRRGHERTTWQYLQAEPLPERTYPEA